MGEVCAKACPGYAPLGQDEEEAELQLRREERAQAFELAFGETLKTVSRHLWWGGLIRWATVPVTAVMGAVCSSCSDGLPTLLYLVPGIAALFSWALERCAVRTLWVFTDLAADLLELTDMPEDRDVRRYLDCFKAAFAASSPSLCTFRVWTLLNHWLLLQVLGLMAALDLICDALMYGQVRQCELGLGDDDRRREFAMAWVVPGWDILERIGSVLDQIGLTGMFLVVLVVVSAIQFSFGIRNASKLDKYATLVVAGSVSPLLRTSDDCCSRGWGGINFGQRMVDIAQTGAGMGEWAAALNVKAFFTQLAAEFAQVRLDGRSTGFANQFYDGGNTYSSQRSGGAMTRARDTALFHIQLGSVIRLVLFHAVPLMYLTLVFMTMILADGVDFDSSGRAKVALSFLLSAVSALSQAWSSLRMTGCSSCYLLVVPPFVALLILGLVGAMVVSFTMGFTCNHYVGLDMRARYEVFSVANWECVTGSAISGHPGSALLSGIARGADALALSSGPRITAATHLVQSGPFEDSVPFGS